MARVNCLGILVVDALSGPIERYPEPKVRPQVVTQAVRFAVGGGAANTGSALAKMGIDVRVFSKVGDDANGEFIVRELKQAGVDTRGIRRAPAENTPFTFVGVHPDGDRTFIHTPGCNRGFGPGDLDLDILLATDYFLYQDCWVLPALDGEPGASILAEARRRGVVTLLDECWGLGPRRDLLEAMLPHCDYFLPSQDEIRVIYPDWSMERVADHVRSLGVGTVVIKQGSEGCEVFSGRIRKRVPALPARVVDTTGAGDCWDAGFIAALVHGEELVRAARIAHACAAFCVEHVGGSTGIPEYAAVVRRQMEPGE